MSILRYALAKSVGRAFPKVHYGPLSGLRLLELEPPSLPGKGWVRLKTRLCGLCGSDLATLFFKFSPQLEPFSSFPAVLGHEILAEVLEVPDGVQGLDIGQRVAVDPLLPCRLRGFQQPCKRCSEGLEGGCEHVAEGCLAPGSMIGFHRDLPGGMGSELVAHVSQLHPVPDAVSDEAAVLVEPLSVSLHAVLKSPPRDDEHVLVIGGGPVAFATLWAIRAMGHRCRVTLMALEPYQLELASRLGADEAMQPSRDELAEAQEVARRTHGRVYSPILGPPAMTGGFDATYDCVGNEKSLTAALRYTRSMGRVVLIGAAGILDRIDWTAVWKNELTILGSYVYGRESFRGQPMHTFDATLKLLERGEGPDVRALVTHSFPLERYADAIEANIERGRYRSVKTVFDMRGTG